MIAIRDVFLIDETGQQQGVTQTNVALERARALGLDLVEVSPHAKPPVCKILDYGKLRYQEQKKAAEARRKQKTIDTKEIKMRPNIDTHDYEVKMRNIDKFLKAGDKVKVTIRFRGREMMHRDLGVALLEKVRAHFDDLAKTEEAPRLEGRQMVMMLLPRS